MSGFRMSYLWPGAQAAINCTSFNHNGNLLITGAGDGMIRLFGECQIKQEQFLDKGTDIIIIITLDCNVRTVPVA